MQQARRHRVYMFSGYRRKPAAAPTKRLPSTGKHRRTTEHHQPTAMVFMHPAGGSIRLLKPPTNVLHRRVGIGIQRKFSSLYSTVFWPFSSSNCVTAPCAHFYARKAAIALLVVLSAMSQTHLGASLCFQTLAERGLLFRPAGGLLNRNLHCGPSSTVNGSTWLGVCIHHALMFSALAAWPNHLARRLKLDGGHQQLSLSA